LLQSQGARSQESGAELDSSAVDERIKQELTALGPRGAVIAEARTDVLEILESQGSCAAWFQETEPSVAAVFRSLHYELSRGTSQILLMRDDSGTAWFKHPWGASTTEYGGRDSLITINSNGPFFVQQTRLSKLSAFGGPALPAGWHVVIVGPYVGDTPEARMTILLHELGHIVGRLPIDDGSWNGKSARNTVEVLRHCKAEIYLQARKKTNGDKAGGFHDSSRLAASREKS
jgi:hypothetical protein